MVFKVILLLIVANLIDINAVETTNRKAFVRTEKQLVPVSIAPIGGVLPNGKY